MALAVLTCLAVATPSMPSIARYLSQVGAPSSLPTAEATPAAYGSGLARGMQQVGADWMQEEAQLSAQADETAAKAADVEFNSEIRKMLYDPEQGYLNKQNKDAVDGFGDTMSQVDSLRQKYAAGLTGRQRFLFDNSAQVRVDAVYQTGASHARQQGQNYQNTVALARANDLASDAAALAGNEQAVGQLYDVALGEWLGVAQRQGLQGEAAQGYVKEKASEWHTGQVSALMARDPIAAQGYLAKHRAGIDGRQVWELEDKIGKALQPYYLQQDQAALEGRLYAASEPGARPAIAGGKMATASDDLVARVIRQESGGRQDAVSPKGATGVMQLMPDTAREIAAEIGVEYDPAKLKTDAAYNERLGRAYLDKMLGMFDGNVTLALAAYNAGPGAVDKWVKQYGDPRSGQISEAAFVAAIPYKETQDYVTRIAAPGSVDKPVDDGQARGREAQLVKGEIAADVMPAQQEANAISPAPITGALPPQELTLGDKVAQVRAMGLPPEREAALLTQVKASHTIEEADRVDRQRNASNTAYARMVDEPTFNPINLTPDEKKAIGIQGMQALNAAFEQGMDIKTDFAVYYDIKQMAAQSKDKFQKLNLMEYAHKLAPSELKSLLDLQANEKKMVDVTDITQMVDDALWSLDINPNLSDKTSDADRALIIGTRRFIDQQLQIFTQRAGREPTRKEQQEIVDKAIIQVKPDTSWFGDNSKRGYQLTLEDLTIDMVPPDIKAEIVSDMQRYGIDPANEEAILKLWHGAGMPGLKPAQ